MNWVTVANRDCGAEIELEHLFKTVKIYVNNPHAVNRKLAGGVVTSVVEFQSNDFDDEKFLVKLSALVDFGDALDSLIKSETDNNFTPLRTVHEANIAHSLFIGVKTIVRKDCLLCPQLGIVWNPQRQSVTCIPLAGCATANDVPFRLLLQDSKLMLEIMEQTDERTKNWMVQCLFPKFMKWLQAMDLESPENESLLKSLGLVDLFAYTELYNQLKMKYGNEMVKVWPEATDPSKFVYEDVAIATYLLLLWKAERKELKTDKLQSFVDLGCGNGLLVYILTGEGHPGEGIDLRKRGIWDLYPPSTKLKVEAITPSDQYLFPNVDWILGNHSDELSPWIPVIAARSSYNSRFWVLPCCAFEFNGQKYQRKTCRISQFADFVQYVQEIAHECGFEVLVDRLKIPSTKRVCIVGKTRNYPREDFDKALQRVQSFIDSRSGTVVADLSSGDQWNTEFTPRESVERVRNCTKIDRNVVNDIVLLVFGHLIAKKNYLQDFVSTTWNVGGRVPIAELVQQIPSEKLKQLKSECGGLQTLLRNNHSIFEVRQGLVALRLPITITEKRKLLASKPKPGKEFQFKQRDCWFQAHHPDGCPFVDAECCFKH